MLSAASQTPVRSAVRDNISESKRHAGSVFSDPERSGLEKIQGQCSVTASGDCSRFLAAFCGHMSVEVSRDFPRRSRDEAKCVAVGRHTL